MQKRDDQYWMQRAIELAKLGRFTTDPNPNVGCVLVNRNVLVGEGFHQRAGEPHAEVYALQAAGEKASGATAYVTLEPCSHHGRTPPCCEALIAAGVSRVVVAMQDPNPQVAGRGLNRLRQAGVEVSSGVCAEEAEALNPGFLKRMRTGLPYLQLKLAASLDGRTAMASGESQWITSAAARQDVQAYRAMSSAILSTGATVMADDPSLTVRWPELSPEIQSVYPEKVLRQPLRVIVDSQERVQSYHRVLHQPGHTLLIRDEARKNSQTYPDRVETLYLPQHQGHADLVGIMMQLAKRQVNRVWTEAGAGLAGALLHSGLVDELILYLAPRLLGDDARGLCHLPGLSRLSEAPEFCLIEVCQIGPDLRLRLTPKPTA